MMGIEQIITTYGPKAVEFGKKAISSIMNKMGEQGQQGQTSQQPAPVSTPEITKPVSQTQPAQPGQPAPQPAKQQSGGGKFYYPSSGYTGISGVVQKLADMYKGSQGGMGGLGGS